MQVPHTKSICFNGIGKRYNNEDALYPKIPNSYTKIFIVCDGVGGNKCGEIASRIMAESIAYQVNICNEGLDIAYQLSLEKLRHYASDFPQSKGMSTTVALVNFRNNFCEIGWIGDSRVYFVRDGRILYQTKDHSLTNKLVEEGRLTYEEANNSLLKNYILRSASSDSANSSFLDKMIINDLRVNDYFLLCTDGFTEAVSNEMIEDLLKSCNDLDFISDYFYNQCTYKSNDNYTMYLIKYIC
ncbi:PP2C family protein-serine/threonine phosphatase [Spirosoma jeollabukense]